MAEQTAENRAMDVAQNTNSSFHPLYCRLTGVLIQAHVYMTQDITLLGLGNQGRAWAENLRDGGWAVKIALRRRREGSS